MSQKVKQSKYYSEIRKEERSLLQDIYYKSLARTITYFNNAKEREPRLFMRKPEKSKSEEYSSYFEMSVEDEAKALNSPFITTETSGNDNNKPDVIVRAFGYENVLEIKTSGTKDAAVSWRGGLLSKRDGDYLLISRDIKNIKKVFAALLNLKKEDWKQPPRDGAGEITYYAPVYDKKQLLQRIKDGTATILVGGIEENKRSIKITRGEPLLDKA